MSQVNPDVLKSATDDTIPFSTFIQDFTTAQIILDTLNQFQKIVKRLKITNNDGINVVTYRTQSPSAPLRTVPINSEAVVPEWTSFVEINPDAVSGSGQIEIDLSFMKDALQQQPRVG